MIACKHCPFRENSKYGYTVEGFECLEQDRIPACHVKVGYGMQFDDPLPPERKICKGYDSFHNGEAGFNLPYLET